MKKFRKAISELKFNLAKLIIFDALINSILVFLVALILFSLLGLSFVYPLFLAIAYMGVVLFRKLKLNKISIVEKTYRGMDEKLRTAAEYDSPGNPVVRELQGEIVRSMRQIEDSAFINERKIYLKCIGIIVLCFLAVAFSSLNVGIPDLSFNLFDGGAQGTETVDSGTGDLNIRFSGGSQETGLKPLSEDLYAEPVVTVMNGEEIKVRITPSGMELNVRQIHEADPPSFSESFPTEVQAVAAESYEEDIAKEDLELVKNYFNRLAEG